MSIRFFSKKKMGGKIITAESPELLSSNVQSAVQHNIGRNDIELVGGSLVNSNIITSQKYLTLDSAMKIMKEQRPDIMTKAFENDFLVSDNPPTLVTTAKRKFSLWMWLHRVLSRLLTFIRK